MTDKVPALKLEPRFKVPHAQSIVAHHIKQAYVFNDHKQQQRIEAYGRLNHAILVGMIRHPKK